MYPRLPTAPVEGGFERYNRVQEVYNELKIMKQNRYKYFKRYSKITSGLQTTSITLGALAAVEATAGIITSLTVVGLPIGLILAGLGGASGLLASILMPIAKNCEKKKLKHLKMYSILDTGVSMLDKKISTALNDNIIEDQEFYEIIEQYDKIKELLYVFNIEKLKSEVKNELLTKIKRVD